MNNWNQRALGNQGETCDRRGCRKKATRELASLVLCEQHYREASD